MNVGAETADARDDFGNSSLLTEPGSHCPVLEISEQDEGAFVRGVGKHSQA